MKTYPIYHLLPYWRLKHINQTCDGCRFYEPFSGLCTYSNHMELVHSYDEAWKSPETKKAFKAYFAGGKS